MTEEQQTTQESLLSPERFETADQMVALHVRMALSGEALDPKKLDLPEVKTEQLVNFDKTVEAATNGSVVDRVNWWEKEWQKQVKKDRSLANLNGEQKAAKQYQIWEQQMIADFKNADNQDSVDRLKKRMIGGIDLNNFNEDTVYQIYKRYFTGEKVVVTQNSQEKKSTPSNLDPFLDDVVAAYGGNYDEIVNDLEVLKWYAGIFGTVTEEEQLLAVLLAKEGKETPKEIHADEVIKELIHAKIKLADEQKKEELIKQANETKEINGQPTTRPNWLNEKEEPILTWLHQASQLETRIIAREPVVVQSEEIQPTAQLPRPEPTPPLKLELSTEEDIKIYFTHPEELLKMPKKNRFEALPTENLRAAEAFCRLLRERIKEKGEFVPAGVGIIRDNFKDEQTGINIPVSSREDIEDAWFDGHGFLQWANKNHLPLAIWAQVRIHATLLLKGPEKAPDGRWRVLIYNPSREGEEREYFEYLNITEDFEVYKQRRTQQLQSAFDPVTQTYFDKEPGSPVGVYIDKDELESHLYWEWFNKGLPPDRTIEKNNLATELLETGEYDFSLKDDQELPADIVAGKIQRFQFDGKNCIPICFFTSALRYAAKPGDNEFKRTGIKQFKEDFFGIKILTREEILAGIKPVETAAGTTFIEAKSFADILQITRQKVEAEEPIELHLDKEGFVSVIEHLLSSIPLPDRVKEVKLLKDPEPVVEIRNQEGKGNIKIEIDAGVGPFNPKPALSFTLTNAPDNQIQFSYLHSDPEKIGEHNVAEMLKQQQLHEFLQQAIQKQLDQQKADIDIESVGLQFTPDNLLSARIKAKKKK